MLCLLVRIETRWRTGAVWVEACSAVLWSRRPPRPASSTLRLCSSSRTRARARQSLGLASGGRAGRGWAAEVRGAESEPPPPPPPLLLPPPPPERSMSATRAKKVKMATKSCPECDQQVGVGGRATNTRASGAGARGQRPLPVAVGCGEAASPGSRRPSEGASPRALWPPREPRTGPAEPRGCRGSARSRGPAGVHLAAVRRASVVPWGWA